MKKEGVVKQLESDLNYMNDKFRAFKSEEDIAYAKIILHSIRSRAKKIQKYFVLKDKSDI